MGAMPDQRQQLGAVVVLAGIAGLLLLLSMRSTTRPPGGGPGPPPTPPDDDVGVGPPPGGEPVPTTLTPEQIAAYSGNGARVARAVPFYENEETWDLNRDEKGRLKSITVHRQAKVSTP